MERQEFQKRCYELCIEAGEKLPSIISQKTFSYAWEVMNHEQVPEATKETLTESVADMYICLMATAYAYDLSSKEVGEIIDKQLGI